MNKAYYTRRLGKKKYPTSGWMVDSSPGSCANNIHSPDSDKLTEVQNCRCQIHVNKALG